MSTPVIAYTDAPEAYDGFGTTTLQVMGKTSSRCVRHAHGAIRKVAIHPEHLRWQTTRYESGMYVWTFLGPGEIARPSLRASDGYRVSYDQLVKLGDWTLRPEPAPVPVKENDVDDDYA